MNHLEFIKALRSIPSEESIKRYKKEGLGDDFIKEYLESYLFKRKATSIKTDKDPIKELVNNYDGGSVTLGMVTFDIEPKESPDYFLFGRCEIDSMVINKRSGEIEKHEYGTESYVLCTAARDSSSFLDAMVEAARFLDACGVDDDLYEDQGAINEAAEKCGELAGGPDYINFYRVLLGSDL